MFAQEGLTGKLHIVSDGIPQVCLGFSIHKIVGVAPPVPIHDAQFPLMALHPVSADQNGEPVEAFPNVLQIVTAWLANENNSKFASGSICCQEPWQLTQ